MGLPRVRHDLTTEQQQNNLVLVVTKHLRSRGSIMGFLFTFSRGEMEAPFWGICYWRRGAEDKPTSALSPCFIPSSRVRTLWGPWRCDDDILDTFTQLLLYAHTQRTNPGCLFRELTLSYSTHHLSYFLLYVLAHGRTRWSIFCLFVLLLSVAKITSSNLCFPVYV